MFHGGEVSARSSSEPGHRGMVPERTKGIDGMNTRERTGHNNT